MGFIETPPRRILAALAFGVLALPAYALDVSLAGEGDRLTYRGRDVNVVSHKDHPNIFEGMLTSGQQTFTPTPGERVDVDLDGDGQLDGYLLLGHGRPGPGAPVDPDAASHGRGAPVVFAVDKAGLDDGTFV